MPPQPPSPAEAHQANKSSLPVPPPPTASSLSRLGAFARCRSGSRRVQEQSRTPHHPTPSHSVNGGAPLNRDVNADMHARQMTNPSREDPNLTHAAHQYHHRGGPSSGELTSRQVHRHIPSIHNLVQRGHQNYAPNSAPHLVHNHPTRSLHRNAQESTYYGHPQPPQTFNGLVSLILSHPSMPLLIGELHETTTGSQLHVEDRRSVTSMRAAAEKCAIVEDVARNQGVEVAANNYELFDVFFAALTTGIAALRSPSPPPVPQPLHAVLAAANPAPLYDDTPRRQETSRVKIPDRAKTILEKWFTDHFDSPYPTEAEKKKLVAETGLKMNQINNYFGNRRMRTKRKKLEQDGRNLANSNGLPYASSVLAPRTKWRTIVRPSNGSESVPNEALEAHEAHNNVAALLRGGSEGIEREEEALTSPVSRGSSSGQGQTGSW